MAIDDHSIVTGKHPEGCDERQAVVQSGLSASAVRLCVSRGLVNPSRQNGELAFSETDVLILKVISFLMGMVTLDRITQTCRLKWGFDSKTVLRWPDSVPADWRHAVHDMLSAESQRQPH